MIGFLRFLGVVNAAVWLGSAVFFTFGVAPAFFTPEMLGVFGGDRNPLARAYSGVAAQLVVDRYFLMHHWCGAIALVHLLAEWLYTGRPLQRLTLWVAIVVFGLGLIGGGWLQPKLKALHRVKYSAQSTSVQKEEASKSFRVLHGVSQGANLIMAAGLVFFFWSVVQPAESHRLPLTGKFRG